METKKRLSGLTGFTIVCIGQIISVMASTMSHFGLTIWMYQQTESVTAMGLMQVFFITPFLVLSPIAGVLVDRSNRKLMMMLSDFGAVTATIGILILQATGNLQFWHLYVGAVINGVGNTFQWPAFSSAISTMVPKEQYGRANGMMSLIDSAPGVVAPLLAGALLPIIGLTGLLVLDVATFFLALFALLIVFVPQPQQTEEGKAASGNMLKEAAFGFKYIFSRPALLGLQCIFLVGNLFAGIIFTVLSPMILAKTNSNSLILGSVQTAGAIGALAGGLIMSVWKGFKNKVNGVLLGWALCGACLVFLGAGNNLPFWIPFAVGEALFGPLVNTSNQAIWQAKVPPDLQGRVFSTRRLIAWITNPISPIIGGVLADKVFEPAMLSTNALSKAFSPIFGSSAGSGMGLFMSICGIGIVLTGLAGYFIPSVVHVEKIMPDYDQGKVQAEA